MNSPVHKSLPSRRLALFRSHRKQLSRAAFAALMSALSLPLITPGAQAANYYWDPGQTNVDPGSGGTETWNTTSTFWKLQGTSGNVVWPNTLTNTADFAGAAGTVTMGSALNAQGVIFDTAGYTLNNAGFALTLGTAGIVTTHTTGTTTVSGGSLTTAASQTWTVATGGTLQLNSNFTSTGAAVYQLTSSGTTNIAGALAVAGKATLAGNAGAGVINLSGTETFNSASTDYTGIQGVTVNNTAGTATFSPGTGNGFFIGNTGSAAAGSILNVTGGSVTISTATRIFIGDGFSGVATTAGDGTLNIGGGVGAALFTTGTTTNATAWTLGNTAATGAINLNANGTLATLRVFAVGAAGKGSINFNGGTLQATGTTLAIPNTVATTIAEGGATIDSQTFAVTLAANFTHGGVAATDGGLRIASTGATPGLVTLSGILSQTGGLTVSTTAALAGNNTYTGPTAINAFVDARTSGNVLGATGAGNGTTIGTGGTLRFRDTGNTTILEAITFNGGTFIAFNDPGTTTLSGQITLGQSTVLSVSPQAQASTTLALTGGIVEGGTASNLIFSRLGAAAAASSDVVSITGASTYGGTTTITDALSANTGNFSVRLSGGNNRLPATTAVTLGGATGGGVAAGSGRLILGDITNGASNQTLVGLVTSGTGTRNAVVGGATTVSTLNLNIPSGTNTFSGLLGGTATNENNLALAAAGPGVLALTGANTYTGGTTITGGTLLAGNATALGGGSTTVSGGVLNVRDTAVGTPAVGMLTMAAGTSLTLNGGGTLTMTLANNGTSDVVNFATATGTLTLSGTLSLNTTDSINYGVSYTLFTNASAITQPGLAITGYDTTNYVASLNAVGTSGVLMFTPVPEPSTYACMFIALGGLAVYARSRRTRREA